jgi:hypothetical protein
MGTIAETRNIYKISVTKLMGIKQLSDRNA